jgi:hypothetical protein
LNDLFFLPDAAMLICLATSIDRLKALRGPSESYSDVILRLADGGVTAPWRADAR